MVHLHNHTLFSILDGVASPEDYFQKCEDNKWPAIAITEHGTLNSVPDAYFASKQHNIKYLSGCEIYYNDYEPLRKQLISQGATMKDIGEEDPDLQMRFRRNRHLTVICKNMTGYENLLKINRHAYLNGFYYKPRVWFDVLAKHCEGLIILSGCLNGPVSHELVRGNLDSKKFTTGAVDYIKKFREVFGDDYYIELQMPGIMFNEERHDSEIFALLASLADNMGIKTVLSNDSHYLDRRDFMLQKLMMAIDQDMTYDDPGLFHVNSSEQYLKTRAELRATFSRGLYSDFVDRSLFESSCDNTLEVAEKCETFKPSLDPKLPTIGTPEEAEYKLVSSVYGELKKRGLDKCDKKYPMDGREVTYREQVEIELKRFCEKGFASYFLITQDLVRRSTDHHNWPVGPARGSAGGSLVCYLLGIHSLDPLKWKGLSFNRFLSPSRGGYMLNVSMD